MKAERVVDNSCRIVRGYIYLFIVITVIRTLITTMNIIIILITVIITTSKAGFRVPARSKAYCSLNILIT